MENQLNALNEMKENAKTENEKETLQWAIETIEQLKQEKKILGDRYVSSLNNNFEWMNEALPEWKHHCSDNIQELLYVIHKKKKEKFDEQIKK